MTNAEYTKAALDVVRWFQDYYGPNGYRSEQSPLSCKNCKRRKGCRQTIVTKEAGALSLDFCSRFEGENDA